jgi:hypothetical protein
MSINPDLWKVSADKSEKPGELVRELLKELRTLDMKGYLPGYSKPSLETFVDAEKARARLDTHLFQFLGVLSHSTIIPLEKVSQLSGDLDEAIRTLKAHLFTLNTWVDWIKGEIGENESQKAKIKAIETSVEEYNDWMKVKSIPKGTTKLGTKIQFQVLEISRRDESYLVYLAETPKGTYRIIQDGSRWRLDRQGMTWEAVNNTEYNKPAEAAAALAELLGV